jgi:hypothetical protein
MYTLSSLRRPNPEMCRFQWNWQVRPQPPRACTFKPQNFYVGAVLNVITDAILLSLPIPMLWNLQVRLSKKIAIGVLLSSGIFVIAAAIIRAVLTLGATPSGLNINRWGVRETIVGHLTVNMPIFPPMFKRGFWSRGSFSDSHGASDGRTKNRYGTGYGTGTFELRSAITTIRHDKRAPSPEIASQGSQENIIMKEEPLTFGNVMVETSIDVHSHSRDEESNMPWPPEEGQRGAFKNNVSANKPY